MAIVVRQAQQEDAATLVAFNQAMAEETEGKGLESERIVAGVEAALVDPDLGRYFVACVDGEIVGQLMQTREWSDWRNGLVWWIQSVYVLPDWRRRGVFRTLYDHLRRQAQSAEDVVGLRLYVERDNEGAQATYVQLGMNTAGYVVMEEMFAE